MGTHTFAIRRVSQCWNIVKWNKDRGDINSRSSCTNLIKKRSILIYLLLHTPELHLPMHIDQALRCKLFQECWHIRQDRNLVLKLWKVQARDLNGMNGFRHYLLCSIFCLVFHISLYILPETMDVAANTSTMSLVAILYNH